MKSSQQLSQQYSNLLDLQLSLRRSDTAFIVALATTALLAVAAVSLWWRGQLFAGALALATAAWSQWRGQRCSELGRRNGEWWVICAGRRRPIDILPQSALLSGLTFIVYRPHADLFAGSLVLYPDSADPDALRRLRTALCLQQGHSTNQ